MQHKEEILIILSEECAEIIQSCTKIMRFNKDMKELESEIADVLTVIELLIEFDYINNDKFKKQIEDKIIKLHTYSELFK